MVEKALIVNSGRVLTARLLMSHGVVGITHCALGEGNSSFSNPNSPPQPFADQTELLGEFIRKRYYKASFLEPDLNGDIFVDGSVFSETLTETSVIGIFFKFDNAEANENIIKEIGFFGGDVAYVEGVEGDVALNGIYDAVENSLGQILNPGYLYEVRNVSDYHKTENTVLEFIAVIDLVGCVDDNYSGCESSCETTCETGAES